MRRYITLLLFIGFAFGQSKMDINNLIDRNGLLYKPNDDKPYTGIVFDLYDNTQKKFDGRYRKGIKNGKWTWWNEDGGTDSAGSYRNGLMNGKWTYYHKNGQMYGQGRFKDGERDGLFTYWHENGEKKEEGIYKKGKKYGEWTYWYENGQNRKITYKDGTPLSKMATITMMVTANVRAQLDPCG